MVKFYAKFMKEKMFIMITFYENLKSETIEAIEEFKREKAKKVVYTSFDGDDMHHMSQICKSVIEDDKIPLNPGMALGYYISTEVLGNKVNVMKDCLTLTLFSDELWVCGDMNTYLPEGIIAEIFIWNEIKNKRATFIPELYENKKIALDEIELGKWLETNIPNEAKKELELNLLKDYKAESHRTVYIGANFRNFKHVDWARIFAYKNGVCPISPQNILNYYLYTVCGDEKTYLKDRLTLLSKVDEYWLFIDSTNMKEELEKMDQFTLAELYMLNTVYKDKKIKIVDWGKIGVPKYNKNSVWALTSKEQKEIFGQVLPVFD